MARLACADVFASDEIAIVHVMNRVVRRCFLLGDDPVTGKNYDHRKQWIDAQLVTQAKSFGIDLLCQIVNKRFLTPLLPTLTQTASHQHTTISWF